MTARAGGQDTDDLFDDFLDFIVCLNEHGVDFVLIGGYALGVHGVVRATGDIDFLYRRTNANVRRLCSTLKQFGAPSSVVDQEALMVPETITQFGRPPHRIDLLNAIDGVSFDQVWAGCTTTAVRGEKIRVIGLADLRTNKTATGRKKDAEDVRKLTARKAGKQR